MIRVFFYKLALIIIPIGIFICSINFIVDPANIFTSKEYVEGIAEILSSGHNIDNISNYDERLLQEQMIRKLKRTPDIIILGSSRIMEIGSDFFPGKTVLNCGVSHANILDLIALVGVLDSMNRLPGEIFINLDPWLIGKNGSTEWQSLKVYYEYFIKRSCLKSNRISSKYASNEIYKLSSIISFSYFEKSIDFLLKGSSKKYYDIGTKFPVLYGRFSDGTISYPYSYTHPDSLKVSSDSWNTGKKDGLPQVDSGKTILLNAMITYLMSKGVKIQFVLLPVHPEYYNAINIGQPSDFESKKSYFINEAIKNGISIVGDFNASALNIKPSSFYDMYHCSKSSIKTIGISE